jgi:tetratricopeptide (TPR) repeat protein
MKHLICELILSCVLAGPGVKPLDELTYGSVLYSYYQEEYQQALLETMVAESQGRRGDDPVRFDLARGSFAFSDRMYEMARQTFAAVDESELTEIDKMRLAFHLAREYHRRSDYRDMAFQLEKIDVGRNWLGRSRHHPEVEFMRAEVAMAAGNHAEAEAVLETLDDGDTLLAYGLYNLGVAYRTADQPEDARRMFERLAGIGTRGRKAQDAEALDLIQRAKLALAVIAREQHAVQDAAQVLGDLPGEGRYRDVALATYGDLAMDNEDYELAARIWLTLQNQAYWTSSTAQARLAFPVSLERLASREMALEQYRQAEASFEDRLTVLTSLSEQAEDPGWVHSLLLVFSSPDRDDERMGDLVTRWRAELGHTDWLEWLATEQTHQVLMEWRELLGMQEWLGLLPVTIGAFEEVAVEQRRRSAMAKQLLEDEALLSNRTRLQETTDAQGQVLENLARAAAERTSQWMFNLATEEERELIEEFSAMRELILVGMEGRDRLKWQARLDRLEGVIFWQIADDRAARTRDLARARQANVALLADVDERIERVKGAEGEFVAGVETDFMAFTDRADSLSAEVSTALNHRELALAGELRRGMAREMKEVQKYLLVTRIGIARATDQLALEADTMEGE